MIKGEKGYQKEHKSLMQAAQSVVTDQYLELYGEEQVYVSTLPVFYWDCRQNEVLYHNAMLLFLSEDLKKMGICEISDEGADAYSAKSTHDVGSVMEETLRKRPKQKFIALSNGRNEMLITEKNELLCDYRSPDISVKGQYYDALEESGISVSWEMLTDRKNLVNLKVN